MKILGLDGGIASIGWAMIEMGDGDDDQWGRIIGAGTWMFDTPETDKERRPKSQIRREKRGLRRIIRRRSQRMSAIRHLLAEHGLLPGAASDALKQPGYDPWEIRIAGLDRLLTPIEWAVSLGHIARHRGFKSNSKSANTANSAEDGEVNKALTKSKELLAKWRSIAEMIVKDDFFSGRRRNRDGDYARTVQRDDLAAEVRKLFLTQRAKGNPCATDEFRDAFLDKAFYQRPLQDSEDKVGNCPFEPDEKRAAKHAYSFEMFRYLSRLAALEVGHARETRRLTPEEITAAAKDFGKTAKISFTALRKRLGLSDEVRFTGVKPDEESRDLVSRTGEAAAGSAALRSVVGESPWASLTKTPDKLDRIAEILSFREDMDSIRIGLEETGIDPMIITVILEDLTVGKRKLSKFAKAGHISAKVARTLLPHLLQGMVYSDACKAAGYNHTDSAESAAFHTKKTGALALAEIIKGRRISADLVGSPIARKALLEAVKQVKAVIETLGVPDAIHVELARDVGKSIDERREIERGIEKRNVEKDKLRLRFTENIGRPPHGEEMLRYELWEEQNGRCVYTDTSISPAQVVDTDNSVQIDHILPWSRFGDDSFANKTLCIASANQQKQGRTPYEWFSRDKNPDAWEAYVARVESLRCKGMKKRNYLLKDGSAEVEQRFRSRNLVDTRWATRLLAEALKSLYPKEEGSRRVYARPGALTNRLRQAWGLQWIKKDEKNQRIPDDRHHALDAIIVAATSESMLNRLTRVIQKEERQGGHRAIGAMDPPWPDFRHQVQEAVGAIFVARAERRRARGEAHAATIRQIKERDGKLVVFERKKVADLTGKDLDRIKDAERCKREVQALRDWIDAGKPTNAPPLSPKGDPIHKVRLATTKKVDVEIRGGAADRGEMAGVDVFRKTDAKGKTKFYLVPIYPHQIATLDTPPNRAVVAHKDEDAWEVITPEHEFLFRLSSHSYVGVVKSDGECIEGYFKGIDRAGGQISLANDQNLGDVKTGIGTKTLLSFKKFHIDRLGHRHEVNRETRTWRGRACT